MWKTINIYLHVALIEAFFFVYLNLLLDHAMISLVVLAMCLDAHDMEMQSFVWLTLRLNKCPFPLVLKKLHLLAAGLGLQHVEMAPIK